MLVRMVAVISIRISKPFVLMFMLMLLLCLVRTCWHKQETISQSVSTLCLRYVNHVLTERKHKRKRRRMLMLMYWPSPLVLMLMIMLASKVRTRLTGTCSRLKLCQDVLITKQWHIRQHSWVPLILLHFDVFCGLLLIRCTATWSVLVFCNKPK